jgi:thioredoxin-related protein
MIAMARATMVALCTTGAALAASEGWTEDYAAATRLAAEKEQDLLIDFTGSDWCGWCIKLKEEVFSHDEFKQGVDGKFVLVELDFPRDKSKLSEETIKQNQELQGKFAVRGFPTIVLADSSGRPYASTGYRPGGPDAYVKHLAELQENKAAQQAALEAARKAEGVEKAKALMGYLKSTGLSEEIIANFYGDITEEIKAADPNDESGFGKSAASKAALAAFEKELQGFAQQQNFEGALEFTNKTLSEGNLLPDEGQKVLATRGMIYAQQQKFDEAIASVTEAIELAPESDLAPNLKDLKQRLEGAKAQAEGGAEQGEE